MERKESQQRERRYVVEFVQGHYPERIQVFYNMRLGPGPVELRRRYPDEPESAFKSWLKYADAVVVLARSLILVEAKIRRPIDAMGQLIHYKTLIAETPELAPWRDKPVELVLVTPREDMDLISTATGQGVNVMIYSPPWVLDYLKEIGWL